MLSTRDPMTGSAKYSRACDDYNLCTIDTCDSNTGMCVFTPIHCDDGDPCTQNSCDPATGQCIYPPVNVDDGNPCTFDYCDQDTGELSTLSNMSIRQ